MIRLLFAAVAGPTAWSLHNVLSPTLVAAACALPLGMVLLHALTAVMALLAASGAGLALRLAPATEGQRFVSSMSVLTNGFFLLAILAQGVPNAILSPCWS